MTPKQKQSHLAKVDASAKENPTVALSLEDDSALSTSKAREPVSCTIGTFEDSKLPECLRGSWVNACKIVDLQGMANHPIDPTKRTVISLSGSTTHTVKMGTQKKQLYCDEFFARFKEVAICAHTIAVAHNEGRLSEFISSYKLPMNRLVRSGIPGGSGKKDNERGCKRKCSKNPPRDVTQFGERVHVTTEDANDEIDSPYEVVFVHETSATTCYGCKGKVRDKPSSPLPPAPFDLFIRHHERRVFNRPGETKIRISARPEMVYYHPLKSCTNFDDVDAGGLVISKDVHRLLSGVHLRHLRKEFGLELE